MDSLYGGHAGISFTIKASFKSVKEMESNFRNGANYRDVWYGEYCLIDTKNKNHKDNGKIYQRDVPSTNNDSGAKYIGQIVGPSSGTPYFQMMEIDKIAEQAKGEIFNEGTTEDGLEDTTYLRFPIGWDSTKNRYVTSAKASELDSLYKRTFAAPSQGLVPGKKTDGTFNDSIKYTWLNIRRDDADADSWFYVGFEVPYLIEEFSASSVSPYTNGTLAANRNVGTTRTDDQKHPYYGKWDIKVPHGIKGDTLRNMRVVALIKSTSIDNPLIDGVSEIYNASDIYLPSAITKKSDGTVTISQDASKKLSSQYTDERIDKYHATNPLVLVIDFYVYDEKQNPTPYMIYVGDYDMIDSVNVSDDGSVTVNYTNSKRYRREKLIKWVKNVNLNTTNGQFVMSFNNGSPDYTTSLEWVKGITIADNGTVHLDKTQNSVDLPKKLTWVKSVTFDENKGNLNFVFNNNETISNIAKTLIWVKNLAIEDNGNVNLTKTNGTTDAGTTSKIATIKWIDDIALSDNGTLTITFNTGAKKVFAAAIENVVSEQVSSDGIITQTMNTGKTRTIKGVSGNANTDASGNFHFKTIENVALNSGIDASNQIQVTYNWDKNGNKTQSIGGQINYIADMVIRGNDYKGTKDWHLLVLYSAKNMRPEYNASDSSTYKNITSGTSLLGTWVRNVYNSSGTLDTTHWWKDFGSVKDDAGILIGLNVSGTLTSNADIVNYLNSAYPNGLGVDANGNETNKQLLGKIVTYTNPNYAGSGQKFFAFDYSRNASGAYYKWYYVGSLGEATDMRDARMTSESNSNMAAITNTLRSNGLRFTYQTITEASAFPKYWASTYTK